MYGDFSFFKYFLSYCQIKASTNPKLKYCHTFVDFQIVIYTNVKLVSNCALQERGTNQVGILSSWTNEEH